MPEDAQRLHIADTERTDTGFSGALSFGAHPEGELAFEDGVATASVDVAEAIADRHPNIELGEAVATADADDVGERELTKEDTEQGPADSLEAPFAPSEYSVDDLRQELDASNYGVDALEALRAAETTGDNRTTALEAIDDALDAVEA